jgi:DNA repair exonuclease SbcCD ATPase subunit
MRINKLSLSNFKGIKELIINANGKSVNIFGENATGKTTIADAFNWLLNGKDSLNRSDFGIKPIDPETQEPISGIETVVEAVLDLGGSVLTLKKRYYEKWVKERGSAEKTFSGNTTDYFIDDVPAKKTEYESRIKEIADEKAFKLLTNPLYFNEQLHWTDRRKMIIQVCGGISDDEVMETNSKLYGLKNILGTHDVEQHKKYIAAKKAEINKELEKIPAKITEIKNMMPDTTGIVVSVIEKEIAELQKKQDDLRAESVRITSGGEIAEKNKRLAEINSELIALKNAHEQKKADALKELRDLENAASTKYRGIQNQYLTKHGELEVCERQIKSLEIEIEGLYERYDAVEAEEYCHKKFEYIPMSSMCPVCGQDIPQERIDAAKEAAIQVYEEERQKAIEAFNVDKANRLERITESGKQTRKSLEQKKIDKVRLETELAELHEQRTSSKAELDIIQNQIAGVQSNSNAVTETPEYAAKAAERAQVNAAIVDLHNSNSDRLNEIQTAIGDIAAQIVGLQKKISEVDYEKKYKARIEELKADEKRLAKEYEQLESELFIVEEFIRTKVKMLDEKINSRFKYVRFKLFNQQINGGLEECCEALINTNGCFTPYSDANAAGRINGGIDIINTLSEHYNFNAPLFIDNAESVVELARAKCQVFRLVVSGSDKSLRVETEDK